MASSLQLRFLKRLIRLLDNGYPLIDTLEIMQWDAQLLTASQHISQDLKNGYPLDEALERAGFSPTVTAYLYVVRANGDLQENIFKCVDMFEQRLDYIKKFQQTTRYPLVLFFIFLFLLYFIKRSVLPSFTNLFQGNDESSAVISIASIVINSFTTILILAAIIVLASFLVGKYVKKAVTIKKQIALYNRIPILHKYLRIQTSFLFATHVSSLLKTGLSMKEILEHIHKQKKLHITSYYASLMINELSNGKPVAGLLSELRLIDKQLPIIFAKNADVHALEKDLTVYAELSTELLNRKITKAITLIQPVFFIILAGFIVFIYLTLMWPMFQLLKTV